MAALLFLAPSMIGLSIFVLIPFVDTVRRSFFNPLGDKFVGMENYSSVIGNDAFLLAAGNTVRFIVICVPLLLVISLTLALLIRFVRPNGKLFKTSYLIPMAIPVASVVLLWNVLFHEQGLINGILVQFGANPINFMSTNAAFWVLIFTYIWKNSGYNMILLLAGLDSISQSLYEASSVDGATKRQQFIFITLPGLFPTLILTTILSLINTFKVFREAYLVSGNYPHDSIYLLQHLFNNWFRDLDLGRLTAAAVLVAIVLLGFILFIQQFWKGAED